ncbi:MCP four helix bundle domain-containing protein, partial [Aeromonas caviae]|uniref:MCP four helix bundle domain-containing protein n=1 Tax=Aeromonas caviae TaxID=648 RepID=UPI002B46FA06
WVSAIGKFIPKSGAECRVEDAVDRQVRRARIQESLGKVQQVMDAYEATVGAEHERQAFNRVKQQWLQYLGAVNQVDALLFQGSRDEAREALFRSNGLYTELELAVRALVKVNLGFVEENRGSLLGSVTILNAKGDSLRRRWEGNFAGASAPLVLNVLLDHLQRCSAARARKVRA